MTLRRRIESRFGGHVPRQLQAVLTRLEDQGVIDLATEVGFGSPDDQLGVTLPNGRRGFGSQDGDYIMTLNGDGGSVALGFAPDTGLFVAMLSPDRMHPQTEVLDALDMDDPSEVVGLVSAIRNTLQAPPPVMYSYAETTVIGITYTILD